MWDRALLSLRLILLHYWDKKKSLLSSLSNGLCIMRFSTLCHRNPSCSQPFVSSKDPVTLSFLAVLSQNQIFFFFFTCTDLFSAEDSKETFWKSPGLSLFAALSFMWHSPLHPAVSALYYNLQGLANLASEFSTVYFIWESLLGPIWAPPCCVVAWKLSSAVCGGNHQPHHLVCFPISGITALC